MKYILAIALIVVATQAIELVPGTAQTVDAENGDSVDFTVNTSELGGLSFVLRAAYDSGDDSTATINFGPTGDVTHLTTGADFSSGAAATIVSLSTCDELSAAWADADELTINFDFSVAVNETATVSVLFDLIPSAQVDLPLGETSDTITPEVPNCAGDVTFLIHAVDSDDADRSVKDVKYRVYAEDLDLGPFTELKFLTDAGEDQCGDEINSFDDFSDNLQSDEVGNSVYLSLSGAPDGADCSRVTLNIPFGVHESTPFTPGGPPIGPLIVGAVALGAVIGGVAFWQWRSKRVAAGGVEDAGGDYAPLE